MRGCIECMGTPKLFSNQLLECCDLCLNFNWRYNSYEIETFQKEAYFLVDSFDNIAFIH